MGYICIGRGLDGERTVEAKIFECFVRWHLDAVSVAETVRRTVVIEFPTPGDTRLSLNGRHETNIPIFQLKSGPYCEYLASPRVFLFTLGLLLLFSQALSHQVNAAEKLRVLLKPLAAPRQP